MVCAAVCTVTQILSGMVDLNPLSARFPRVQEQRVKSHVGRENEVRLGVNCGNQMSYGQV